MSRLIPLVVLTSLSAYGKDIKIGQKNRSFHLNGKPVEELVIKAGDRIIFVNDDNTVHNVFSKSEIESFNLKIQKPNSETPHTFSKEGKVMVRCAIHPKMKLIVTVSK